MEYDCGFNEVDRWGGLMGKVLKLLLVLLLFISGFYFVVRQGESSREVHDLPWVINSKSHAYTQVFGVEVGKNTLAEMSHVFGKLPELAIFQNKKKERMLEAYFSRVRLGVLRANIVAVLDVDYERLSTYADFEKIGKPMPSGLRKYALSLKGLKASGMLTVWKLAYMPAVDYTEEQLFKFFGEPKQKTILSDQRQYWHYPDKALLIAYDAGGKEIFHYASKKNYKRLTSELLDMTNEK